MFRKSRQDLFLLLDDGWDVPFNADPGIPGRTLAEIGREAGPQDAHSAPGTLVFSIESPLAGKSKQ